MNEAFSLKDVQYVANLARSAQMNESIELLLSLREELMKESPDRVIGLICRTVESYRGRLRSVESDVGRYDGPLKGALR